MSKEYTLRYTPLFYRDMEEKILYITNVLKNPSAAEKLLADVETAILERLDMPESFEPYNSERKRQHPYYRIYVRNFVVFYVVINEGDKKYMEIRRFLYGGQNARNLI